MGHSPKANGQAESLEGIAAITVSGFKSIAREQEIEVRPLTILAGANSSGKSSMIQPLLLLKQTLDATYDPGPLLLDGPHVKFTSSRQFLPIRPRNDSAARMTVGLRLASGRGIQFGFLIKDRVELEFNRLVGEITVEVRQDSRKDDIHKAIQALFHQTAIADPITRDNVRIFRDRFNYGFTSIYRRGSREYPAMFPTLISICGMAQRIQGIIHVPGLRGTTARAYPTTATGPLFPGTFDSYVASLVARWGEQAPGRLKAVGEDLARLGLTWKVEANEIEETRVELRVGRLKKPKKGGARDVVSIADVGFGVSQTLPVVVALRAAEPGQLVYIEQPEIHLHPRAQSAMAELLADAARRGVRVVAETHSALLILGIQSLVAEGKLSPDLVKFHWFHRDEADGTTRINSADLDEAGRFGDWPEDFADVVLEAENRYLSAAEARLAQGGLGG